MATRRKKGQTKKSAPTAAPVPSGRDIRPYVYLAFNQLFVVGYFYVLIAVIPNRLVSALVHLWALPVLMQVVAVGTATVFLKAREPRRIGWWLAVGGCSLLVVATILLIIRVLVSAAFLAGVYGAFGKAAAMSALIGVALIVEIVALLPLFQLKYLRTRAGRRVYGLA